MLPDGSEVTQVPIAALGNLEEPSVSPDGFRVAFRVGNDIYTANADGMELAHIVTGPSYNGRPRWSPDGTEIAFHSTRSGAGDIYAIRFDGTGLRQITSSPEPEFVGDWSPDGALLAIVYRSGDRYELGMVVANGDGFSAVPTLTGGISPSWSPDGTRMVYEAADASGLRIVDITGANDRELVPGDQDPSDPAWSPSGSAILYSHIENGQAEIASVRPDGTDRLTLTHEPSSDVTPGWGPEQ